MYPNHPAVVLVPSFDHKARCCRQFCSRQSVLPSWLCPADRLQHHYRLLQRRRLVITHSHARPDCFSSLARSSTLTGFPALRSGKILKYYFTAEDEQVPSDSQHICIRHGV